ncbi:MAG TPA: ATP-binding protein [Saprospiraceae bacterium]|nr:ATP-binding protein [Saprospiraceae bacterium]
MIKRDLEKNIKKHLIDKKAIVIMGARQVGKTTLLKYLFEDKDDTLWLNADQLEIRTIFNNVTLNRLKSIIGEKKIIIIDEAQRISDIGIKLKLIVDQIPSTKLIVTGSSSFQLSASINEPLTGRKWEYKMYPLSFKEMVKHHGILEEINTLEQRLLYGYYPEVIQAKGNPEKILQNLTNDYLYKDILEWGKIKNATKINTILQALALQLGNEVSYNELSKIVGLDKETVEKYIDLLEKSFVIFRLKSFNRNIRKELRKSKKIYFYDNGIRNALIANFSPLSIRNDKGALWENFLITERLKYQEIQEKIINRYFWRTTNQQEIDYIEERNGVIHAFEFKWSQTARKKFPGSFIKAYPNNTTQIIHPGNFENFVGL